MDGERLVKNKMVTEQSHFGKLLRKIKRVMEQSHFMNFRQEWVPSGAVHVTKQSHFGDQNLLKIKKVTEQSHFGGLLCVVGSPHPTTSVRFGDLTSLMKNELCVQTKPFWRPKLEKNKNSNGTKPFYKFPEGKGSCWRVMRDQTHVRRGRKPI